MEKSKAGKWFFPGLIVVLVASLLVCFGLFLHASNHKRYRHNRMLEYEHLQRVVNLSDFRIEGFREKWGADFRQYSSVASTTFYVESAVVLKDPFFEDRKYAAHGGDFYGYEFRFDDGGNLKAFGFHKD